MATKGLTVSHRDVLLIQGFLRYLQKNYSKQIRTDDSYTIAAVASWFYGQTNVGKAIVGNNPFKIYGSSTITYKINEDTGKRTRIITPGKLLRYASLAQGFAAAAAALMKGATGSVAYLLALNSLKLGGNDAAVGFLAAMSQTRWDVTGYGAGDWQDAYNKDKNKLLGYYVRISGVQLRDPHRAKTPPAKKVPKLPRDTAYISIKKTYIDPWQAGALYSHRHSRVSRTLDEHTLKR